MRLAHVVGANAPFLVQVVKEKLELEAKGVEQTAVPTPPLHYHL
jgi:Nucleoside diphosphate kinase